MTSLFLVWMSSLHLTLRERSNHWAASVAVLAAAAAAAVVVVAAVLGVAGAVQ